MADSAACQRPTLHGGPPWRYPLRPLVLEQEIEKNFNVKYLERKRGRERGTEKRNALPLGDDDEEPTTMSYYYHIWIHTRMPLRETDYKWRRCRRRCHACFYISRLTNDPPKRLTSYKYLIIFSSRRHTSQLHGCVETLTFLTYCLRHPRVHKLLLLSSSSLSSIFKKKIFPISNKFLSILPNY